MIDTITLYPALWLEENGAKFCRVAAFDAPDNSPGKRALGDNWQDTPLSWADVAPHVKAGGNVGMICGQHSGGLILVDVDENLTGFLEALPHYADYPHVVRDNPDKAKFVLRLPPGVEWEGGKKYKRTPQDKHPFLELLCTGNQGVIPPSRHPSGELYRLVNADKPIPTVTPDMLALDVSLWVDVMRYPTPTDPHQPEPTERQHTPQENGGGLRDAVRDAWTPLRVFEHFSMAGNGTKKEHNWIRILGNGGLFVHENGQTWALPSGGKGWGGDVFDAWHYAATHGESPKLPHERFYDVLCEMATVAGIPIPANPSTELPPIPDNFPPDSDYLALPVMPETGQDTSQGAANEKPALGYILECLNRNEYGDAELLTRLYAGRLCFDAQAKEWLFFDGNYWQPDTTGKVKNLLATDIAAQYIAAAAQIRRVNGEDAEKLEKALLERSRVLRYISRTRNVLGFAESMPGLATDGNQWDRCDMLLPVSNGVIDLKTGEIRQGKPTDFIKTFAPTPWQGINAPAQRWDKFLQDDFLGNTAMINGFQRWCGYAITGKCTERVFGVAYGEGSNGKSTTFEIIAKVLGSGFSGTVSADALMDAKTSGGDRPNPALYSLRGKRLAWASESKEGQRLDTGLVKLATGGIDQITVRTLYQSQPITFRPTFALMLLTNHKPHIPADDLAMWDRVRLWEFSARFVEKPNGNPNERKKDPNMAATLEAELSGILAWLVRGALAWQREGLNLPKEVFEATQSYRLEEDTLHLYATERLYQSPAANIRGGALYQDYCAWCRLNNLDPMNGTVFGRKMSKMFTKSTDKRGTTYPGIALLETTP